MKPVNDRTTPIFSRNAKATVISTSKKTVSTVIFLP